MKDKQRPDEELFDELDTMYQRVADFEEREAASEHPNAPYEYGETTVGVASSHGTIVSSPGHRAHGIPEKPFNKKPGQNKKWFSRRMIIIPMSLSLILFALILTLAVVKPTITPRSSNLGYVQQKTLALPSKLVEPLSASPSVQTEQEAMQKTEENLEKKESNSQANKRADNLSSQNGYYAIQVGAFHEWENARDLMEVCKREGLDAYWISRESRNRGILYRVFVGRFMDRNEAAEFVKGNSILSDYPGSFIRMISSSEMNHSITHPPDK
jgi:cell division septation protein DedD